MITEDEKFIEIQGILTKSDIPVKDCIKINDFIIELSKEKEVFKKQLKEWKELLNKFKIQQKDL